jgi:RNA polymerase sigma-70 factor, ECF subfamily
VSAGGTFAAELCAARGYLLRFALVRLRDPDLAQDAVQETLLAALESNGGFAGRSALRTWLTGILKHKIVDQCRRMAREAVLAEYPEDLASDEADSPESGVAADTAWSDPVRHLERARFWEAFERGLGTLPPNGARALLMRDVHGHETTDICHALGVTASNCWVILHRSRSLMRGHLNGEGYGAAVADGGPKPAAIRKTTARQRGPSRTVPKAPW